MKLPLRFFPEAAYVSAHCLDADDKYVEVKDAIEFLNTRRAEELRTGWQPIETVPRDGTVVLLHYSMNHLCGYASSVRPKKKIAVGYFDGRWVDGHPGGHGEGGGDSNYTHWMPLPAAPEGEG